MGRRKVHVQRYRALALHREQLNSSKAIIDSPALLGFAICEIDMTYSYSFVATLAEKFLTETEFA